MEKNLGRLDVVRLNVPLTFPAGAVIVVPVFEAARLIETKQAEFVATVDRGELGPPPDWTLPRS